MNKRGQILTENVIFIILNLVFLIILMLFVFSKTGNEAFYEEKYSKQIALIIDSAKPGMTTELNMEDVFSKANENGVDANKVVTITGNLVTVKLRDKTQQSYSFFNDVSASAYPKDDKTYVITVNGYN